MCKIKLIDIFPGKIVMFLIQDLNLWTLQDLLQKTEKDFLSLKGFGEKRLQIVRDTLNKLGFKLREN